MMNREEALKWLVENINEGWPGHLHIANYSGWLLTSYTNMKYMVSFAYTKDGENPIKIDDWKEAKRMQMTSREDAIKWAVENLNEWPLSFSGSLPCKDWRWIDNVKSGGQRMQSEDYLFGEVTEQDWLAAKQPTPLTRDQALAWLVDNVKAWPKAVNELKEPGAFYWTSHRNGSGKLIISFDHPNFPSIYEYNWQAARSAPASNKPSWDDAPESANVVVCTAIGTWYWGSYKNAEVRGKHWHGVGDGKWIGIAEVPEITNPNWRDTLEHRPATEYSTPVDMRQVNWIGIGVDLDAHAHKNIVCTPKEEMEIRERRAVFSKITGIDLGDDDRSVTKVVEPSQEEKRDAVLDQLSKNLIRMKDLKSSIALEEVNIDLMRNEYDKLFSDVGKTLGHFGY